MPGMIAQTPAAPPTPTGPPGPGASAPAPANGPKGTMDPILQKVRDGVESKLPPDLKDSVDRVVVAALKLLYDPTTHQQVQQVYDKIAQGGFQPQAIATGMVNLLGLIFKGSQGKMSVPAAYPAGVIVLTYALDDLSKMKGLKITDDLVKQTGKIMANLFVKAFGIHTGDQPGVPAANNTQAPSQGTMSPAPPQPLGIQGA